VWPDEGGQQLFIQPVRPVNELIKEALQAEFGILTWDSSAL